MQIRNATDADRPSLLAAVGQLFAHHDGMYVMQADREREPGEWLDEYLKAAESGRGVVLVVDMGGGIAGALFWREIAAAKDGKPIASGSTFIFRPYRRLGFATLLRARALDALRRLGFAEFIGMADAKNAEGLASAKLEPVAFLYRVVL